MTTLPSRSEIIAQFEARDAELSKEIADTAALLALYNSEQTEVRSVLAALMGSTAPAPDVAPTPAAEETPPPPPPVEETEEEAEIAIPKVARNAVRKFIRSVPGFDAAIQKRGLESRDVPNKVFIEIADELGVRKETDAHIQRCIVHADARKSAVRLDRRNVKARLKSVGGFDWPLKKTHWSPTGALLSNTRRTIAHMHLRKAPGIDAYLKARNLSAVDHMTNENDWKAACKHFGIDIHALETEATYLFKAIYNTGLPDIDYVNPRFHQWGQLELRAGIRASMLYDIRPHNKANHPAAMRRLRRLIVQTQLYKAANVPGILASVSLASVNDLADHMTDILISVSTSLGIRWDNLTIVCGDLATHYGYTDEKPADKAGVSGIAQMMTGLTQ